MNEFIEPEPEREKVQEGPSSVYHRPKPIPPIIVNQTSSSTPPPFPQHNRSIRYDVFLSFRGADTSKGFTDHLYSGLVQAGIHTFKDDDELERGVDISKQLKKAIEESKVYIVVFSKNYASSRWCLDELVDIIAWKEKGGRVVLPVFYSVEPYEVRRQRGSYAEAFENYEAVFDTEIEFALMNRWRAALTQAANLSGYDLQSTAMGFESRLITQIVEEVLSQVKPKKLFVAKHRVGLKSRIDMVYHFLRFVKNDVHPVGIYGMGGQGKTVIAKAVYNEILEYFELTCFLANVREVSEQPNGLVYLQEQLLSELLKGKYVKVGNVDRGIRMIGERFCLKKVLIVLDDVDHLSQVNALIGSRRWFGPKSRIIITTRDQHLLHQVQVDDSYEAQALSDKESLELFSWHAFHEMIPPKDFAGLSYNFVAYSGGLALALEVLGSY